MVEAKNELPRWGEDPGFSSFCKLFIAQIYGDVKVDTFESVVYVFEFKGRPISKVDVMGIVREIIRREKKLIVKVDDGTGVINCVKFLDQEQEQPFWNIHVGHLVSVKGNLALLDVLSEGRQPIIQIRCLEEALDPNLELLHWARTIQLQQQDFS